METIPLYDHRSELANKRHARKIKNEGDIFSEAGRIKQSKYRQQTITPRSKMLI